MEGAPRHLINVSTSAAMGLSKRGTTTSIVMMEIRSMGTGARELARQRTLGHAQVATASKMTCAQKPVVIV